MCPIQTWIIGKETLKVVNLEDNALVMLKTWCSEDALYVTSLIVTESVVMLAKTQK